MPHLNKIPWWQQHSTPWERRLFIDSVHRQITSIFWTNQDTYKMTCDSKINLFNNNYKSQRVSMYLVLYTFIINKQKNNLAHGEVYSIQHYVIKCVNYLQQIRWFSPATQRFSSNKTDHHDLIVILLKHDL
jgi:hypothetical protein